MLVLIVAGVLLWAYGIFGKPSTASTSTAAEKANTNKQVSTAVNGTVQNPDYAAATKAIDSELKATSDSKQQATLYSQKAAIAAQQGNYQEVINDYTQASKLDDAQAGTMAVPLAKAYEQVGDKQQALVYYKKAYAYYSSQKDNYSGKQYFVNLTQAKIQELGQ